MLMIMNKLAYIGAIWSLLSYIFFLGIGIVLADIMPLLHQVQPASPTIMNLLFVLGILGIAISLIIIIAIRKTVKRLSTILIITGTAFIVLQGIQYLYVTSISNISEISIVGIIPSILVIVSGLICKYKS